MSGYIAFFVISAAAWMWLRKQRETSPTGQSAPIIPATLRAPQAVPLDEVITSLKSDRAARFANLLELQDDLRAAGVQENIVRTICDQAAPLLLLDPAKDTPGPTPGIDQ